MNDIDTLVRELTLLQKAALLSGKNTWETRDIPALGIPSLWLSDGPHGLRKQAGSADHLGLNASEPATCFPTAATIANSWDIELAEQIGVALGAEASAQGVHVLLGPGLNIKRSPLGGRNFEYFSEDPELAGRLAAAYVRGIQSEGVAASPKHFAVNSQELRRLVSDSVLDERTLRELYLTAFEIVVREARPWTIMSSYNLVRGTYAHENHHLLTEILRDEWGFDGAVVSDWGGGNDPVSAVRAGGTLEMPSPGYDSAREIVAAVENRTLAESDLDARVAELLELVRRVTDGHVAATVDTAAHHALARRAAAESTVMLRNEGGLLPLEQTASIALIGDFATRPRYQGAGSSEVNATTVTNLVDSFAAAGRPVLGHAPGFRRDGVADRALVGEALALAARADVVVLALGQPEIAESEGLDKSTLALPADQIALLHSVAGVNPRTVVVLSAGGAIETPWAGTAQALLHAYLGGQAGAEAIVDVLTGLAEPAGRLAETLPVSQLDSPTAGRFPSTLKTAEYREGLYVGYRYFETAQRPVAYPFGFGLGYTSFAYSDLAASADAVSFTVTNTGERAGADVPQLYVRRRGESSLYRPARELKAFAKVRLQPGQSQRVTLTLDARAFRYFDTDRGAWEIEDGDYELAVGHNVRDLALSATVTVTGSVRAGVPAPSPARYLAGAVADASDDEFAQLLGGSIPPSAWPAGPLGINDPMDRLAQARTGLARFAYRILDGRRRKAEAAGHPDLNTLFLLNGPFRIISKMSGGLATREVTDGVLTLVNGHFFRGLGQTVSAFFRGRGAERRTDRRFHEDGQRRAAHSASTDRSN